METVALLEIVLYRFRDLFGSQNFSLFCAYLYGVILCCGRHSVTQIYLASGCEVSYWSLLKFLSRGKWDWQKVCGRLIRIILVYVPDRLYLYDHTYAVKTGKQQFGLQFFSQLQVCYRQYESIEVPLGASVCRLRDIGTDKDGHFSFSCVGAPPAWGCR